MALYELSLYEPCGLRFFELSVVNRSVFSIRSLLFTLTEGSSSSLSESSFGGKMLDTGKTSSCTGSTAISRHLGSDSYEFLVNWEGLTISNIPEILWT